MLTAKHSAVVEKRDLHVGALGGVLRGTPAAMVEPLFDSLPEAADNWLHKARSAAGNADHYLRSNPWQAVGLVALVGLAAGFLLARRA